MFQRILQSTACKTEVWEIHNSREHPRRRGSLQSATWSSPSKGGTQTPWEGDSTHEYVAPTRLWWLGDSLQSPSNFNHEVRSPHLDVQCPLQLQPVGYCTEMSRTPSWWHSFSIITPLAEAKRRTTTTSELSRQLRYTVWNTAGECLPWRTWQQPRVVKLTARGRYYAMFLSWRSQGQTPASTKDIQLFCRY